MKRKEQKDLWEEDQNRGDAFPCTVEQEGLEPARAAGADEVGGAGEDVAETVGHWLADGEDDFKDANDDHEKEQRSQMRWRRMLSICGCFRRKRGLVAGAAADLRPRNGCWRRCRRRGGREACGSAVGLLVEEERNGIEAGAVGGADEGHGAPSIAASLRVSMRRRGSP